MTESGLNGISQDGQKKKKNTSLAFDSKPNRHKKTLLIKRLKSLTKAAEAHQ
jgi:hypothetical protein